MRSIEVHFEKNINNLSLVREADTKHHWEYIAVALLGAMFVAGVLFYGWQSAQYIQYGYKIEAAQQAKAQLVEKGNRLRVTREQLENPTRIESMAKDMGMVPFAPGQLVSVNLDTRENTELQLSAKK